MIIKNFEINKINFSKNTIFLLYGENESQKQEAISLIIKNTNITNKFNYEESEIIENKENFFNSILSKSFFEDKKTIIISRASDKIKDMIEEIYEKDIQDIVFIINSGILEKKSKLRNFFEKNKNIICIPFYQDTNQNLSKIANEFFSKNKIKISQRDINLIIERSSGKRDNLYNEMNKIKNFISDKKIINTEEILKLINLSENLSIADLVDYCLLKNKSKINFILNENNFGYEDCIIITRTFINKLKRLLKIQTEFQNTKNLDKAITTFKPPIFWKDKDIIKNQISKHSKENIQSLLFEINDLELQIKKNSFNSINLVSNFVIEQVNN